MKKPNGQSSGWKKWTEININFDQSVELVGSLSIYNIYASEAESFLIFVGVPFGPTFDLSGGP